MVIISAMPLDLDRQAPRQARAVETRRRLLDAAVDELLDRGYAGLTTPAVAARAGVSRGAQQNHFPRRIDLVAEAVRHLALRHLDEMQERLRDVPNGRQRVAKGLDLLFDQYSGRLFAAVIDLSLAARTDPELGEVILREERNISRNMQETATTIFGPDFPRTGEFASRWATVLSTIRGLALLKLLGHRPEGVDRQWSATRGQMLALLEVDGDDVPL
jgi:AcrR family transcriptional regulator